MKKIRILIADDHPIVREGYKKILMSQPDMDVTGEAGNGQAIDPAQSYRYVIERGALPDSDDQQTGMPVSGKTLLDMSADDYRDAQSARQGKQLMRMLLNHHLGGKMLHTRELIKDLTKL